MSTNKNIPLSQDFWEWMQSYWHTNRSFPPVHPDWKKKADLVDGKVPAIQLPSYVDDVLEFNSYNDLPQPGEKGKIYITIQDNKQFRWSGSVYIEINSDGIIDLGSYLEYEDNRSVKAEDILPNKFQFGFTSWENNNNYPWADYIHFGGYNDASGGSQNLIMFNKNGFGLRQYQDTFQNQNDYQSYVDYWNTDNLKPVTINSLQTIDSHKTFSSGIKSARYEWSGLTMTPAGKVSEESAFFNLGSDYGYGISTNINGGLDIMANQVNQPIRFWAGNNNDNPFNVVNFYKENVRYNTNISINEGKEIRLKGQDDIAHFVKHFSDDTDGFGVSTGFAVKPYNDTFKNLLLVDGSGTYVNGNRVWDMGNFNPEYKAERENNALGIGFYGGKLTNPFIRHNFGISYLFCGIPVELFGSGSNADNIQLSGFYAVGNGTLETGNYSGSEDGKRALLHLETEDIYSASQIQTERYNGNILSRTKTDGSWSNWIRHWGSNDFTANHVAKWNDSISNSSASEEIIMEDDILKIQPDEFVLEGNGSYDISSNKKQVHVLFRDGINLNIRDLTKRQTIVIFNFSTSQINLNIGDLKSYPLASETQITLYITEEMGVLLYNETGFKKL